MIQDFTTVFSIARKGHVVLTGQVFLRLIKQSQKFIMWQAHAFVNVTTSILRQLNQSSEFSTWQSHVLTATEISIAVN